MDISTRQRAVTVLRRYLPALMVLSVLGFTSPETALGQGLFPGAGSSSSTARTGSTTASVYIPHHGLYTFPPELLTPRLNPGGATNDDLLAAAVFSADYESDIPAHEAALHALSAATRTQVTAALLILHSSIPSPASPVDTDAPIIVLGNGLNIDGSVHPNLANRLKVAREEAIRRPTSPVVLTGGRNAHGFVEAEAMRDWLIEHGISEDRILLEKHARSTVDNARFTRNLLPGVEDVILVTSANHIPRAMVVFTLTFGPHVTGVSSLNDPPTPLPSTFWTYRDAVAWFLE